MLDLVLEREHELIVSAVLGTIFSIGIIYFLHKYPGQPFDYGNDRYVDNVSLKKKYDDAPEVSADDHYAAVQYNTQNNDTNQLNEYVENLNEDDVVMSTQKLQKVFGISEDNVRSAVRQTKDDVRSGRSMNDDGFTYSQLLDFLVMGGIVCTILYFIDIEAHGVHGDISKVLKALFPLEFDTLGVGGRQRGT